MCKSLDSFRTGVTVRALYVSDGTSPPLEGVYIITYLLRNLLIEIQRNVVTHM